MVISEERKQWNQSRNLTVVHPKIMFIRAIYPTITSFIHIQALPEVANKLLFKAKVNQKVRNPKFIQATMRSQANLMEEANITSKYIILIRLDLPIECLILPVLQVHRVTWAIITGRFRLITLVDKTTLSVFNNIIPFFLAEMEATPQITRKASIGVKCQLLEEVRCLIITFSSLITLNKQSRLTIKLVAKQSRN